MNHISLYGPVASKHSNQRSLLYASSMAYLGRTIGRHRHVVGKGGGGAGSGGGGEYRGREGQRPTGPGTAVGEAGELGEGGGSGEKENRWWGPLRCNRGSTEEEVPIKSGTYNIRNGRNGGLETAIRGMEQANLDMGIMQDTKITDGVYTRASAGYRVVATDAPSLHSGGIAMFYREGAGFAVEEVMPYGPNVISFEVLTGRRRWYIIGCYLAPDDARTVERVVTALGDQPRGTALIVAGDLNTDMGDMECDGRGAEIAAAITEAGLEDMAAHFLPRKRKWGRGGGGPRSGGGTKTGDGRDGDRRDRERTRNSGGRGG